MNQYQQYDNLFDNNTDLDKMAREINNNKKKKLDKKIFDDMQKQAVNTCVGIDCLTDPSNSRFAPTNLGAEFSYLYPQGDFQSGLPNTLNDQIKKRQREMLLKQSNVNNESDSTPSMFTDIDSKSSDSSFSNTTNNSQIEKPYVKQQKFKKQKNYKSNYLNHSDSMFDPSYATTQGNFSDISSNYSSLPPELKKQIKTRSLHLNKYKDGDERNILTHITKCTDCRNQLADLLKTVVVKSDEQQDKIQRDNLIVKSEHDSSQIFGMNTFELKDLLIILVIGIFIIIFIDIFIRR